VWANYNRIKINLQNIFSVCYCYLQHNDERGDLGMTRLNATIRDAIIANAVTQAGIPAALDDLQKRRAEWVDRVRIEGNGISDAELKRIDSRLSHDLAKIPKEMIGWHDCLISTSKTIETNVAGHRVLCSLDGRLRDRHLCEIKRYSKCQYTVPADNPLADEWTALDRELTDLNDKRDSIRQAVRAKMSSHTTIKKLLAEWPEVEPLLPPPAKPATTLPAVCNDELNNLIGLPV
jgi:hypothetical protein